MRNKKADYDKMSKMSGAAFDKMFSTHTVADHQKDIAESSTKRRPRSRMRQGICVRADRCVTETSRYCKIFETRQVAISRRVMGSLKARMVKQNYLRRTNLWRAEAVFSLWDLPHSTEVVDGQEPWRDTGSQARLGPRCAASPSPANHTAPALLNGH
jgi:hypothetical protein